MRCGKTWWGGAIVTTMAITGCFTEPGGLDDAGWAGQSNAGAGGTSGGTGGGAGSGASGTAGQAPAAGSGGTATAGSGGTATPGSGGTATAGSGGTATPGAGGMCSSAAACGGDLVGTWTVSSSCLVVKGSLDLLGFGLGCASAGLTGSRVVAGTFTANAGGTYVDRTTTSGEEIIELPEACLSVAGTLVTCERLGPALQSLGYDSVTCEPDGGGCRCSALFEQSGGMGVLSLDPSTGGTYEAAGSVVTLHSQTDAPKDYRYCVTEDQLTILPQTTPTDALRGTLVLARE